MPDLSSWKPSLQTSRIGLTSNPSHSCPSTHERDWGGREIIFNYNCSSFVIFHLEFIGVKWRVIFIFHPWLPCQRSHLIFRNVRIKPMKKDNTSSTVGRCLQSYLKGCGFESCYHERVRERGLMQYGAHNINVVHPWGSKQSKKWYVIIILVTTAGTYWFPTTSYSHQSQLATWEREREIVS